MLALKSARIRQLAGGVPVDEPAPPRIDLQPRFRIDSISKHDKALADSFLKREASAARGSQPLLRRVKSKLTRPDKAVKRRPADFRENYFLCKVAGFTHKNAGRLGHAFDDQAVRHDRKRRVQIVQVLFRQRYVLDRGGGGSGSKLRELVDPDPAHEQLSVVSCQLSVAENADAFHWQLATGN